MKQTFIGLDLGTTFLKGAVLDLDDLSPQHIERLPFPDFIPQLPAGHREVDPQVVMRSVRQMISILLPYAGDCRGLVMCTQMHGLVLCDLKGEALTNVITWQDQRTLELHPSGAGSYYDVLSTCVSAEDRKKLGCDLWASRPLSYLFWLHENGCLPAEGAVVPTSLPDFVLANLCETTPVTGPTNAAAYGAYDLNTADWHHDLISRLRLDHLTWPAIKPHGTTVGVFELDGHRLPCYIPVGDHQCAVLGTLLQQDELSINISTGSQVGLLSDHLELSLDYQTRPYIDGRNLKAVIHIPAGRALNALLRLLTELADAQGISLPNPWDYINAVTQERTHSSVQANMAFFPSSCGDMGFIQNLREDNLNIADLFTAAFENMADNYLDCVKRITATPTYKRIVFSGGLVQKLSTLQHIILNRFHLPYRYPPYSEDTMLGLLIMGLVYSGKALDIRHATQTMLDKYRDSIVEYPVSSSS